MDVMKPDLMWIDGRCYRINQSIGRSPEDSAYVEEDFNADYNEFESDEPCDEFEVETLEGGRCRTSFHVAKSFFPCIIGVKGSTKRRLENETKTQVKVPKQGQDGDIVVVGADAKSVRAARRRVSLIVAASRLKQPFTHFLCLPFNGQSIQEGFGKFKEAVLAMPKARGVDPSIFQSPGKLHLTLTTLHLADGKERQEAGDALRSCSENVIRPLLAAHGGTLRVRMRGIEYMNDDPREVDVLYGKLEMAEGDGSLLQRMADAVVQYFADLPGGYCEKQYDSVKLHVTVMNTLFREDAGGAVEGESRRERGRHRPRESFDATAILQQKTIGEAPPAERSRRHWELACCNYVAEKTLLKELYCETAGETRLPYENKIFSDELRDFSFGEQVLEALHLSQRYTTSSDGFYQASEVIDLIHSP